MASRKTARPVSTYTTTRLIRILSSRSHSRGAGANRARRVAVWGWSEGEPLLGGNRVAVDGEPPVDGCRQRGLDADRKGRRRGGPFRARFSRTCHPPGHERPAPPPPAAGR